VVALVSDRTISTSLLECRAVLFSFCARFSRFFWTGQPLTYPAVQKSGAAALAGDVGSENRRQLAFDRLNEHPSSSSTQEYSGPHNGRASFQRDLPPLSTDRLLGPR
jgi:hypothetical protein